MRTETINIYKIDEHPDKDKCFGRIRNNDHYIGDFEIDELVCTLKKLSEVIGGTINWDLSHYPERDEHITFKDYDEALLYEVDADDCPLTGCFWDGVVIDALKAKNMRDVLEVLHDTIEHHYSDEALTEMCEANDYEFYIGGEMV